MFKAFVFLDDQVAELNRWPGANGVAIGSYILDTGTSNTATWYRINQSDSIDMPGHQCRMVQLDDVPKQYRTMALLIT